MTRPARRGAPPNPTRQPRRPAGRTARHGLQQGPPLRRGPTWQAGRRACGVAPPASRRHHHRQQRAPQALLGCHPPVTPCAAAVGASRASAGKTACRPHRPVPWGGLRACVALLPARLGGAPGLAPSSAGHPPLRVQQQQPQCRRESHGREPAAATTGPAEEQGCIAPPSARPHPRERPAWDLPPRPGAAAPRQLAGAAGAAWTPQLRRQGCPAAAAKAMGGGRHSTAGSHAPPRAPQAAALHAALAVGRPPR